MKPVIAIVFCCLTGTTKLLGKMELWNKMSDGFCIRDFNLLVEIGQHNTELSEIILPYSSERRKGGKNKTSGWCWLRFLFSVSF